MVVFAYWSVGRFGEWRSAARQPESFPNLPAINMNQFDQSFAPEPQSNTTNVPRRAFTQQEKQAVWDKASKIPGCNPDQYRADPVGNPVCHKSYGLNSDMGWHVD